MSTGRNDPCPCGSGKKYKQCHGGSGVATTVMSPTAPLFEGAQRKLESGDTDGAIALYRRILDINPEHADARHYLGMALCFQGDLPAGLPHMKASVALRPLDAVYRNNLGQWLEESGDLAGAEQSLRQAVEIKPDYRAARLSLARVQIRRRRFAQSRDNLQTLLQSAPEDMEARLLLADALHHLGEHDAVQRAYREILAQQPQLTAVRLRLAERLMLLGLDVLAQKECALALEQEPGSIDAPLQLAFIEERRGRKDVAEQHLRNVLANAPGNGPALISLARLLRQGAKLQESEDALAAVSVPELEVGMRIKYWQELGMLRDRQARYGEAFECYRHSKEALRIGMTQTAEAPSYEPEKNAFDSLRRFATPERSAALAALAPPAGNQRPLFITGLPRSGTTLVEQMLSMHPAIHAGDELFVLNTVEAQMGVHLGTTRVYPEALQDFFEAKNASVPRALRDIYMDLARQAGAIAPDAKYFTDKSTLYETRLPLIRLLFPESPVVHVVRHPLDVVLSIFQNEIRHNYALEIETIATHYALVTSLALDIAAVLGPRYLRIRYEDLVQNPETELRRLLEGIGEPWDPRCLDFSRSERVARTISYAQVKQPLYSSSRMKWQRYREQLAPAIPILEPIMARLGYGLD